MATREDTILMAKYVALDSSSLRQLSSDAMSSDATRQARARRFLRHLEAEGCLILISMMHVLELIQHDDDLVADEFPRFLATLPVVAWVGSAPDSDELGTIVDILAFEILAIVDLGATTLEDVVRLARRRMLRFDSGIVLLEQLRPHLEDYRSHARNRAPWRESNAGLSSISVSGQTGVRFSQLQGLKAQDPRALAERSVNALRDFVIAQLRKKAEVSDPTMVVDDFLAQVAADLHAMGPENVDPATIARYYGVAPEEIKSDMTTDDLGKLVEFRQKVSLAARRLGMATDARLGAVTMDLCPTWIVSNEIRNQQSRAPAKARGSDLYDSYLAALCCYADCTEVDKRTDQYLRQGLRGNDHLRRVTRRVVRTPFYQVETEERGST